MIDDGVSIPAGAAAVDVEGVHCPLCEYDLRGLTEPRCPECGYRFQWAELLNRHLNTHPYLFEHYPRNNIWSFAKTLFHGLNPVRFWTTLRPAMEPNRRRLFLYWALCTVIPMFLAGALQSASAIVDESFPKQSPQFFGWVNGGFNPPPAAPVRPAFADAIDNWAEYAWPLFFIGAVTVSWVVLTYLSLMICQETMHTARILTVHITRCVLYSFDIGIAGMLAGIVITAIQYYFYFSHNYSSMMNFPAAVGLMVLGVMAFAGFRLWMAYRNYLTFPHAFWVVLSSQIIAGLTMMIAFIWMGLIR